MGKSRYKGKKDTLDIIHKWHEFGQTISKDKPGIDSIKLKSLSMPNKFSSLFIDLQHYGKLGNDIKATTYFPEHYYIPKQLHASLISLFQGLNLKEELQPILLMAFASMATAAANAPKFELFLKQTKQQKNDVMSLLGMLDDLKLNKKKICSIHFKYHDIINGNSSKKHSPFTISGALPADFFQSILAFYEQTPLYGMYKNIKDFESSGKNFDPPQSLKSKNKKSDYYAQGLMLFLLKFHIKGISIANTEPFDDPRLRWPDFSADELKKFKIEDLYLFVGKMLELSGLIEYKPKKEEAALKDLRIEDDRLIERIRKRWANKPETPKFSFGLILPASQVKK
jgi:hypothetical protein